MLTYVELRRGNNVGKKTYRLTCAPCRVFLCFDSLSLNCLSLKWKHFTLSNTKRSIRVEAGVAAWTGKWHSYALKNTIVIKIGAKFLAFVVTYILKVRFYRFLETGACSVCCIPYELCTMWLYSNEKLLFLHFSQLVENQRCYRSLSPHWLHLLVILSLSTKHYFVLTLRRNTPIFSDIWDLSHTGPALNRERPQWGP